VRLTGSEREALERFEDQDRTYRRGTVVIGEHESPRDLFIVRSGWLHSSVVLGNGSRQIIRFHFEGDMLGMPLLAFPASPESVTAATDVTLAPFGRDRVAALVGEHPRLAALLLSLAIVERVMFADRLALLGRTPARARVAAVLCDIYMRMRALGTPEGGPIPLPLTQDDIGDATGLTAVHVNRMMRVLVEERIIERRSGVIGILDEARLCAEASFLDRVDVDTGWLPPAR
jgi:CRP-like cAMP-binding protein